jgi:tyrosyl-tRNA synthetase
MARYYELLLCEPLPALHPMEAKQQLAFRIVERYHTREAAQGALEEFRMKFSQRDVEHAEWPVVNFADVPNDLVSLVVAAFERGYGVKRSRSEARRLIEQGSVQLRGEKLIDPKSVPALQSGDVLRLDKTRAVRAA